MGYLNLTPHDFGTSQATNIWEKYEGNKLKQQQLDDTQKYRKDTLDAGTESAKATQTHRMAQLKATQTTAAQKGLETKFNMAMKAFENGFTDVGNNLLKESQAMADAIKFDVKLTPNTEPGELRNKLTLDKVDKLYKLIGSGDIEGARVGLDGLNPKEKKDYEKSIRNAIKNKQTELQKKEQRNFEEKKLEDERRYKESQKPVPKVTDFETAYKQWVGMPEHSKDTRLQFKRLWNAKDKYTAAIDMAQKDIRYMMDKSQSTLEKVARDIMQTFENISGGGQAGQKLTVEKAKEYLQKAQGNRKAAEAMAKKDGWTF